MNNPKQSSHGNQSRRSFLKGTAAALTGAALPGVLHVDVAFANSDTIHHIANRATKGASALAPGAVKKTISILIPGGSGGNLTPFLEEWKSLTGLAVELIEVPNTELYSKAMQEAVAKTGQYDLIIGPVFALPDFTEAGLAKDLDPYVEKYQPELDHGAYRIPYPFSEFGCKYDGGYRALYADADNWALYMRKDWMEDPAEQAAFKAKYGRDLRAPDTWEDYDQLIEFFTRPEEGRYGSLEYRAPFYAKWQWMQRFCSKGMLYFDKDMTPLCNSPEGIAALEELIESEAYLPKESFTNGWSENYNQYGIGNVFSTFSWPSFFRYNNDPAISEVVAGNLLSAPVPGTLVNGELIRASVNAFGWLYVVNEHSAIPELAYLFAQWHTAPDVSDRAIPMNGGYFDPTRTNHFKSPGAAMKEKYTQAWLDAAWDQIDDVIPDFVIRGTFEYSEALDRNCVEAVLGKKSAEQAMNDAAKEMARITRRMGKERQIQSWHSLARTFPEKIKARHGVHTWT